MVNLMTVGLGMVPPKMPGTMLAGPELDHIAESLGLRVMVTMNHLIIYTSSEAGVGEAWIPIEMLFGAYNKQVTQSVGGGS